MGLMPAPTPRAGDRDVNSPSEPLQAVICPWGRVPRVDAVVRLRLGTFPGHLLGTSGPFPTMAP